MFTWHKSSGYRAGVRRSLKLLIVAGFAAVAIAAGCGEVTTTPIDPPTPIPTPIPTPTPKSGGDDLDLSRVTTFILPSVPGVSPDMVRSAKVTAKINSASTDGRNLSTSYERYSFPSRDGVDAVCYFFYEYNGTVMGGKFDWWRTGGQGVKNMENVHHGYGGHKMPSPGTKCWTMFSSTDGKQRSNTCTVVWK